MSYRSWEIGLRRNTQASIAALKSSALRRDCSDVAYFCDFFSPVAEDISRSSLFLVKIGYLSQVPIAVVLE
ncbi:MAG: hypothetical protein DMF03_06385 [Verrucomicrobia bacterium]|nr:MAG: hypothetical protein DMF03_06385 [Verrucomicrobiota bacterium]